MIAAVGLDESGHEMRGYYFEVSGSGTAVHSGRAKNADLFRRVEEVARQVGDPVSVTSWKVIAEQPVPAPVTVARPNPAAPQASPADRLRQVEQAWKEGLISKEEYEAKRAQILSEM